MIKTRQKLVVSKIWDSINKNWGVAIGFLMLLFLIPVLVVISYSPSSKSIIKNNADASKPLVHISPDHGQGNQSLFVADVTAVDVNQIENVDLWFGQNSYSVNQIPGNYSTISLQNFGLQNGNGFDWRALVYSKKGDGSTNVFTSLSPDDSNSKNISTIYSIPSTNPGEVNLSASDNTNIATSSIKFIKVVKKSSNLLEFYLQTNFTNKFEPSAIKIFMKAKLAQKYGGQDSATDSNPWTQVGLWNASMAVINPVTNLPPKFTSIPSTKAQVGTMYKYNVTAIDPENDALTYAIATSPKPAFLNLDGAVLSGTPSAADVGPHTIVISVSDPYGNVVTQSWTINVSAAVIQPSTPSATITITSPVAGTKFSGVKNDILWSVSSPIGMSAVKLSYSLQTGNDFKTIISNLLTSDTKFSWDTSLLSTGKYIIKIDALDSNGNSAASAVSGTFDVANVPVNSNIVAPKLSIVSPQDGETITNKRPLISANVTIGSSDVDLPTTLKIYLDANAAITSADPNLTIGSTSFSYQPSQDLSTGKHTIRITLKGKDAHTDADGLDQSWSFTVNEQIPGSTNQQTQTTENVINLPLIGKVPSWLGTIIIAVFVILLFGILIFAIIMLIRLLRNDDDETTQITKYYQQENPPVFESTTQTNTVINPLLPLPETPAEIDPFQSHEYNLEANNQYTSPYAQPGMNAPMFGGQQNTSNQDPINNNMVNHVDLSPFETTSHEQTIIDVSHPNESFNPSITPVYDGKTELIDSSIIGKDEHVQSPVAPVLLDKESTSFIHGNPDNSSVNPLNQNQAPLSNNSTALDSSKEPYDPFK